MKRTLLVLAVSMAWMLMVAANTPSAAASGDPVKAPVDAMDSFDHIVVIVEQDHTFDSYFRGVESSDQAVDGSGDGSGDSTTGLIGLARQYVLFDRYFASSPGGTLGNMLDLTTGSTHGLENSSKESLTTLSGMTAPTVFDSMNDAGVDWRLYVGDLANIDPQKVTDGSYLADGAGVPASLYRAPILAMRRTWSDPALSSNITDQEAFFDDTDAGTLPSVSFVLPSPSDHPGVPGAAGETRLLSLVNAVAKSSQWPDTLVLVVWDDGGGQFDSVAPPVGSGLRVPLLLISAHARHGFVSSAQMDHRSLLGFIEQRFGLASLSGRSQDSAASFGDALDPQHPPRAPLVFSRTELPATPVGTARQNLVTLLLYLGGFIGAALMALLGWRRIRQEDLHVHQPS